MIEFRRFWNSDSPGIVAVWNRQSPSPRRLSLLNCTLLDQHVLAKPYFDPRGLIVAVEGERIVGFVHAGFLPGRY